MASREEASFEAFVELRCACGRAHTLLRKDVLDGLCTARWRCGTCKRRFVIACAPGEESGREQFFAVYLDDVPSLGSTRQEGSSIDFVGGVPAQMHFQCRCGCRLVGRAAAYGRPLRCPKCSSRLVLRPGVAPEDGRPVPVVSYP